MDLTNGTWSQGTIFGVPGFIVAALVCVGVLLYGVFFADRDIMVLPIVLGACGLAIAVIVFMTAYWPFDSSYHKWYTVAGVVKSIDSRQAEGDSASFTRMVITYAGGEQYGCDDTRCAAVRPGDLLTLRCKREWQYEGTPGYLCNFVANGAVGE